MAKSDSTTFKSIVQAIPAIAGAYREGLQALESKDAGKVKPQNPRKLSGSVYLDKCLKTTNPHDARWDYVIGYREKAYFVEVHPANTSNVDEVVKKKKWGMVEDKCLGFESDDGRNELLLDCFW